MATAFELAERETARRQVVAMRERNAIKARLRERDAAYAAQFPASASGNIRGRTIIGGHVAVRNYNPVV